MMIDGGLSRNLEREKKLQIFDRRALAMPWTGARPVSKSMARGTTNVPFSGFFKIININIKIIFLHNLMITRNMVLMTLYKIINFTIMIIVP